MSHSSALEEPRPARDEGKEPGDSGAQRPTSTVPRAWGGWLEVAAGAAYDLGGLLTLPTGPTSLLLCSAPLPLRQAARM